MSLKFVLLSLLRNCKTAGVTDVIHFHATTTIRITVHFVRGLAWWAVGYKQILIIQPVKHTIGTTPYATERAAYTVCTRIGVVVQTLQGKRRIQSESFQAHDQCIRKTLWLVRLSVALNIGTIACGGGEECVCGQGKAQEVRARLCHQRLQQIGDIKA